jgi:hypothetical protein
LITAAAAIMAAVFFSFGMADLVVIKAIGIGMGIAVVLDANDRARAPGAGDDAAPRPLELVGTAHPAPKVPDRLATGVIARRHSAHMELPRRRRVAWITEVEVRLCLP